MNIDIIDALVRLVGGAVTAASAGGLVLLARPRVPHVRRPTKLLVAAGVVFLLAGGSVTIWPELVTQAQGYLPL